MGTENLVGLEQAVNQASSVLADAQQAYLVAKSNLAFARMTPSEKRAYLAHDVCEQIRLKRLKPITQFYVKGEIDNTGAALKAAQGCSACAIGAMFVCAVDRPQFKVRLEDGLDEVHDWSNLNDIRHASMTDALRKYFEADQLALIETAFECRMSRKGSYFAKSLSDQQFKRAQKFGRKYKPKERMTAIMKNIVKNAGTFKP